MTLRNNHIGKVFSDLISDTNTPSFGIEQKHARLRSGQRSSLVRMGISKKTVKTIIQGR